MCIKLSPLAISICLALLASQTVSAAESETDSAELESITVTASADASAEGLSPAFAGGQVAEGGRAGILGTKDNQSQHSPSTLDNNNNIWKDIFRHQKKTTSKHINFMSLS